MKAKLRSLADDFLGISNNGGNFVFFNQLLKLAILSLFDVKNRKLETTVTVTYSSLDSDKSHFIFLITNMNFCLD